MTHLEPHSSQGIDLTDSVVAEAYPIVGMTYALVRAQTVRQTCTSKVAALRFLEFIYTDALAADIVAASKVENSFSGWIIENRLIL
jgi:hypothetical protein